jgi:hypothetical protein
MIRADTRGLWLLAGLGLLAAAGCGQDTAPPPRVESTSAPRLRTASPQALSAIPGELITLNVSAEDPQGGALSFTWKANTGTLGVPVLTGDTSEVVWTALSCVPAGVKPTIEATITNSAGLSLKVRYEVAWSGPACSYPPCDVGLQQKVLLLKANCVTATTVFIPDGHTLDGQANTVTGMDPGTGSFVGAIVRNRGETALVRHLTVQAQRLLSDGPCAAGDSRLRGIWLQGASGSVEDSQVLNIRRNKPGGGPDGVPRGCQEGIAIEARALDGQGRRQVSVLRNVVSGYQKGGILVAGQVDAIVAGNTVTGAGPVGHIAQNGVQLSDGAAGQVTGNQVTGHSYTGSEDVAAGVLVAGGPLFGLGWVKDALIQGNTLTGNDVGLYLDQAEANGGIPLEPTRLQVLGNVLSSGAVTNGYPYQAAISDLGGGNIIHSNSIAGAGYDPATQPGATFDVDVVAGEASQVVFLTPAQAVAVGACSGKVVVQAQDAKGNLSKPTPATFALMASGTGAQGLTFHADPSCMGPALDTVGLGTPEAAAGFYFQVIQPGQVTLSVSNGNLSAAQAQGGSAP